MHLFVLIAGVMGVALFVAGLRRPRVAVFVAAILWLLYAYYETLIEPTPDRFADLLRQLEKPGKEGAE